MGNLLKNNEDVAKIGVNLNNVEVANDKSEANKNQKSLSGKEKANKWGHIWLAILLLIFFVYDAIWADPYLAWRYFEVYTTQSTNLISNGTIPEAVNQSLKFSVTTLAIFCLGSAFSCLFCFLGVSATEVPEKYPDKYRTWKNVIVKLCILFPLPLAPFALRLFIIYLMIEGYQENRELYNMFKHRGLGSAIMVICTEDMPQAVLQLYIYMRKEYDLEDIGDDWDDTKHLTLINLASSLTAVCVGASFVLQQLSEMFYKANPKKNQVYDIQQGKLYTFGGGHFEESMVYSLSMPHTKMYASAGFIIFSLLNILTTLFILSHVTAILWPSNFGLYYIAGRILCYYIAALISWWGEEGPGSFIHSLTYIIVMLSRVPILDKAHSKFGQQVWAALVTVDIPLNLVIYFYSNNWEFGSRSFAIDILLCLFCSITMMLWMFFFMLVQFSTQKRITSVQTDESLN